MDLLVPFTAAALGRSLCMMFQSVNTSESLKVCTVLCEHLSMHTVEVRAHVL